MRQLFLTFLLLPFLSFSQLRDSITIKSDNFEILYSEVLEQPILVKYSIPCPEGSVIYSRRGIDFYKTDKIHTSDSKDYYRNVWDKGHMVPSADFNCDKKLMKSVFSYVNCALQHEELNRKQWKYLERHERKLTQYGDVYIIIKIIFTASEKLPTGATIPSFFQKEIYLDNKLYGIWKFPNNNSVIGKKVNYFKVK